MPLTKALLLPWFGPYPPWMDRWLASAADRLEPQGYSLIHITTLKDLKHLIHIKLSILDAPIVAGQAKAHDYRPALGKLLPVAADYWGWCDFDIVWGRIERFWPDDLITEYELVTDCEAYVGGPFTLLRNTPRMRDLFMEAPEWRQRLTEPQVSGWGEHEFSRAVERECKYLYKLNHAYEHPESVARGEDGSLLCAGREVSFYHFRRSKEWPCTVSR